MNLRSLSLAIVVTFTAASAGYSQDASETALATEIRTLQEAVDAGPVTAPLLSRLSQAYAMANRPEAALAAIEGALILEPQSADYLRARATLATWTAQYERARDSYRQLARLQPLDPETTLNYARVGAWAGDTDTAVSEYRKYLAMRPDAAATWLELARTESWRGNYASALDALSQYRERFGESPAYQSELAGVLASSGRPSRAQDLLTPLLAASPNSSELNFTRTVVLTRQHRARAAFDSLATLRTLSADRVSIRAAERMLRTEFASSVEPRVSVYSDSDHLEVQRFAPTVNLSFPTGTRITGSYERTRLESAVGNGLEQLDGSPIAEVEQVGGGLSQKIGRVSLSGQVGQATVEGQKRTTYGVGVQVRALDTLSLTAERMDGLFVVSPRTVSLGMTQVAHHVQAEWALGMRYHLSADATHLRLSDGNERLEMTVSPRRTMARTASFNLDLGLSAYRLQTTRDLSNGYYDPRRYESYAITALPYFKLHENVGLAMTLAGGAQRDIASSSFHFGGTVSGEATFGIYASWLLKVNSSATMNQRLDSGAFRGFGGSVALIRRF